MPNYLKHSPVKTKSFVSVNLLTGLLFLVGFLFKLIGFPYLLYFFGWIFFFMPGLNMALLFEQITKTAQGKTKIILWATAISFVISPLVTYISSIYSGRLVGDNYTILYFSCYWAISFLLLIIFYLWKKFRPTEFKIEFRDLTPFAVPATILLITLIVNFLLYRYIPEADSYSYLIKIKQAQESLSIDWISGSRPLFTSLVLLVTNLTQIPPYWLFKLVFPTFICLVWLLMFAKMSKHIQSGWVRNIIMVAFLFFPVIVIEMLFFRPQSVFVLALPIILFLTQEIVNSTKDKINFYNLFWIFLIFSISVLGMKIHEMFVFTAIITVFGLIVFLWRTIRNNLFESFTIALFILIGVYPWLKQTGVIEMFRFFLSPFAQSITHPHFNPWFIDDYINVDGAKVGWPNYTWILYYLYNLGVFIPIYFLIHTFKKGRLSLKWRDHSIYVFAIFIFFLIAEVFPRLGLAYLPDRAWLLIVLVFSLILPSIFSRLEQLVNTNKLKYLLLILLIISVSASWLITYLKKGWVTANDFKAIQYLNKLKLDENSVVVLGQGSSRPSIRYYSNYKLLTPNKEFVQTADSQFAKSIIDGDNNSQKTNLEQIISELNKEIDKDISSYSNDLSQKQKDAIVERISANNKKLGLSISTLKSVIVSLEQTAGQDKTIYFYYSQDKFKTIYTQREWWRKSNLYKLDIELFNAKYPLVYSDNGVYIWKIK